MVLQKFYLIPKPVPVAEMQNVGILTDCKPFVYILPSKDHSGVQEGQDDKTEDTQQGIDASLQMCYALGSKCEVFRVIGSWCLPLSREACEGVYFTFEQLFRNVL